jgi:hypothetical protein
MSPSRTTLEVCAATVIDTRHRIGSEQRLNRQDTMHHSLNWCDLTAIGLNIIAPPDGEIAASGATDAMPLAFGPRAGREADAASHCQSYRYSIV